LCTMPPAMAKFKLGDHVQKTGLVPIYLKHGIVKEIIPNADQRDDLTEYKVDFKFVILKFYQWELELADDSRDKATFSW
jgi:hypothetical protein